MRYALVLGSAGFVGRYLTARLHNEGWGYDGIDLRYGTDLLDFLPSIRKRYDTVFHLAANIEDVNIRMSGGYNAYKDIILDLAVADYCRRCPPKTLVWPTSCAVDNPADPYAWVKLTGERIFGALAKSGQRVVMLRPFSGYGPDQALSYPFPAILNRAWKREDPLTIWGTGRQVRDWLHIDDLVEAFMVGSEKFPSGIPIDIGTGIGTSLRSLASLMALVVGYQPTITPLTDKAGSSMRRVADPTVAESLGFKAKIRLWTGIEAAVQLKKEQQHEVGK